MPVIVVTGECRHRVFSLTPRERLERQLARLSPMAIVDLNAARRHEGDIILVRADALIDTPLLPVLLERQNLVLLSSDGRTPVAAHVPTHLLDETLAILSGQKPLPESGPLQACTPENLGTNFWKSLRKRETPYALVLSDQDLAGVEWRMFMGTYKGATDFVTKHVWPWPAFLATRFLAPLGVSPNMVTIVGIILVFLAFYLFIQGQFAAGLAAAWIMTFLDTVDGKLARTTLTSSKWGDILDHGVDLVHPPFWYIAWASGLAAGYVWSDQLYWSVIAAILGGYILQRIMEGIAIKWLGLEIHIWRPIDTFFRQITARRNPNLVILTLATLIGRPDWGLVAVAAWTVVCLILHGLQLVQGLAARRQGPLVSWMTKAR
jgi:phosphatidylglycerophosphate synthase